MADQEAFIREFNATGSAIVQGVLEADFGATAKRELIIQNPYFIPDNDTVELLSGAVKRGVDVRIMVPGPLTDSGIKAFLDDWSKTGQAIG